MFTQKKTIFIIYIIFYTFLCVFFQKIYYPLQKILEFTPPKKKLAHNKWTPLFVLDTKRLHSLFFYLFALFFGKLIFIISYKERIVNQDGH